MKERASELRKFADELYLDGDLSKKFKTQIDLLLTTADEIMELQADFDRYEDMIEVIRGVV